MGTVTLSGLLRKRMCVRAPRGDTSNIPHVFALEGWPFQQCVSCAYFERHCRTKCV